MPLSLLYPLALLGALAIAAPIWLHLRRKTETNLIKFSALRFLDDQPQPRRSPMRLRDWLLFTLRVLALLLFYFARHTDRPLAWLPTGLLLGGALGNMFDRLHRGAVTDFIDVPLWPSFNVADMAITFGVLSLLYVIEQRTPGAPRHAGP